MSVKPILFSTTMVQAILDGRKTMTRRVMKPQPVITANGKPLDGYNDSMIKAAGDFPISQYQPGDILWVRETWNGMCIDCGECAGDNVGYQYKADSRRPSGCAYEQSWRPPIFMPKEACRLFLRVTDVRAERLQEITEVDAKREGVDPVDGYCDGQPAPQYGKSYRLGFSLLWDHLNAKCGYGWGTNPWVWMYTFERCEKPEGWCK